MTIDVAVIGGGVSGLATAHALAGRGYRVVVLERQVRAGGNAISERISGFLMEHGPSTVNAALPEALALSSTLGLDGRRGELGPNVKQRYLTSGGRLHSIPVHPFGFLTSNYLSPLARLRLLAEPLVPARRGGEEEETVADFAARRFGRQFADRVIDPLVGGLHAGLASELSVGAVFPALVEMERTHGSIIRGVMARRRRGGAMPGRRLYSWREGVASLPRALALELGASLKLGVAVRRVRAIGGGFRIDVGSAGAFTCRAVVLATQPHVAAGLLDGLDSGAAEAAAGIAAPALAVVFLGYRKSQVAHPLDGLGYLSPVREGGMLSGAQFCSTMFAGRAPAGHVALAGYVGGARAPDLARLPAAELIELARREFAELLGAKGAPVLARVRAWPRGLPQYQLGHASRLDTIRAAEGARPGLFVTGNYVAGPSVAACVAQAVATAARVHACLGATGRRAARRVTHRDARKVGAGP